MELRIALLERGMPLIILHTTFLALCTTPTKLFTTRMEQLIYASKAA